MQSPEINGQKKSENGDTNGFHKNFEDEEHDEHQYLKCIENIIKKGATRSDRTGKWN
jgi:hypothetical protein